MQNTEIDISNLDEYSKVLLKLRKEKSSLKIKNDSLEHAKILVTNLFEHAQKEVLIYTSSLCALFYLSDELKKVYKELSSKRVSIKVLVQYRFGDAEDGKIGQSQTVAELQKQFGDKIEIKFLEDTMGKHKITFNIEDQEIPINNFTVVDGVSFRYERQETAKGLCAQSIEDKYTKAIGCMSDKQTANLLSQVFKSNFSPEK